MPHTSYPRRRRARSASGFTVLVAAAAAVAVAAVPSLPAAAATRVHPFWPTPAPAPTPAPPTPAPYRHHHRRHEHEHEHEHEGGSGGYGAQTCSNPKPNKYDPDSDDKVEDWTKSCAAAENEGCPCCDLWTDVARPARDKQLTYVYSDTNSQRAKILPTAPLQGLESIVRDKEDGPTSFLWARALDDAAAGKIPNVQRAAHPIAFINSLNARTQHQMHIHVGAPSNDKFYECSKGVLKSPPAAGKWETVSSAACDALSSRSGTKVGVLVTAASGSGGVNSAIRAGFPKAAEKTDDITQDYNLLRTGVLVEPHPTAAGEFLVFLLTGTHVSDETIF